MNEDSNIKTVQGTTLIAAVLIVAGLSMASGVMLNGAVETKQNRMELAEYERYGIPEAYAAPFNVRDWNGETIAVLWPDGTLEKRAGDELIMRTMIDRHVDLVKAGNQLQSAAKRARDEINKLRAENAELRKQAIQQ